MVAEGGFAQIYLGTYNDRKVAVKRLNLNAVSTLLTDFRKEIGYMQDLNHEWYAHLNINLNF